MLPDGRQSEPEHLTMPATDSDSNDDDDAKEQSTASTATTSPAPDPGAAVADEPADCCKVCLVALSEGFALVPCGHDRFCELCEQSGYARLLPRVPCKYQHSHVYLHVG